MTRWRWSSKSNLYLPALPPTAASVLKKRARHEYGVDAAAIRKHYKTHGVVLNRTSGLEALLRCAEEFSKLSGESDAIISTRQIFDAIAVSEIRRNLDVLEGHPKAQEYLQRFATGKLSYYDSGESVAKNFLWELEVCSRLRQIGFTTSLAEPDVVWDDAGVKVGIACKKIYSEAHVQNVLSKAIKQINKAGKLGYVAFNLDELIPPGKALVVTSEKRAGEKPLELCMAFLKRHERHFLKYFKGDRLSGVIASTSCRTKLDTTRPGFFINTQWMCWTQPDVSEEHLSRSQKLSEALGQLE